MSNEDERKITLRIEGDLIAWKTHRGYGRRSFNPLYKEREYVQWQIKKQLDHHVVLSLPVRCSYTFYFPIQTSSSKSVTQKKLSGAILPVTRPDLTNLVKFYEDCLKGIVFTDDSQVTECFSQKMYSIKSLVVIEISKINVEKKIILPQDGDKKGSL